MQWCGLVAAARFSLVAACVLFVCKLVLGLLVAATLQLLSCSNLAALSCSNLALHCLWLVCGSLCVERV